MTTNLTRPISLIHPPRIEFGSGIAPITGRWVREKGFTRALVVADAFNARRVDQLGLDGTVTVFGDVKPEPDVPNLQALLACAEAADAQVVGRLRRRQQHGPGQSGLRFGRQRPIHRRCRRSRKSDR